MGRLYREESNQKWKKWIKMIKKVQFDGLLDNLKVGMGIEDSAVLVGISKSAVYKWEKTQPDKWKLIQKAIIECKKRNMQIIQKAAITTWQAAAWYLERKYSEEYAIKQKHELTGKEGHPIKFIIENAK